MHIALRLIIALLAAAGGIVLGFLSVVVLFLMLRLDAGIGGGLIALLVGIISGIAAAIWTFIRLGRRKTAEHGEGTG